MSQLTQTESAELQALVDEIIAKSGPNTGGIKANTPQEKIDRYNELKAKGEAPAEGDKPKTSETDSAKTETPQPAKKKTRMVKKIVKGEKSVVLPHLDYKTTGNATTQDFEARITKIEVMLGIKKVVEVEEEID